ncbi:MAG TPA: hypothetical protein VFN56_04795 [Candidatus Saccharimonadales bacterium]|nr:hypothetical protein [Candidatus Saccharimonadales bacterium]
MKRKDRKSNYALLLFIVAVFLALFLGALEVHTNNSLPYASNDVLANERIRLLYIYGAKAIPLFILGLVLAIRRKVMKWIVINGIFIALVVVYVLFFVGLISAFRNLSFSP